MSAKHPNKDPEDRPHIDDSPAAALTQDQIAAEFRKLGEAVVARCEHVLTETVRQTASSGQAVEAHVQGSFERICVNSTVAVARWIAGDGLEVTKDSARETSHIFGELAAHRAASLHEVTRRSMWWRNVMGDELRAAAAGLATPAEVLEKALAMLQLSLEFTLLRVCECFEAERQRTDDFVAAVQRYRDPRAGPGELQQLRIRNIGVADLLRHVGNDVGLTRSDHLDGTVRRVGHEGRFGEASADLPFDGRIGVGRGRPADALGISQMKGAEIGELGHEKVRDALDRGRRIEQFAEDGADA